MNEKPVLEASPDRYMKKVEEVYIDKVYKMPSRVQSAEQIVAKLEQTYIQKPISRLRIHPWRADCLIETTYQHKTVLWEGVADNSSDRSKEENLEPVSEYSYQSAQVSLRSSQVLEELHAQDDYASEYSEKPAQVTPIEVYPSAKDKKSAPQSSREERYSDHSEISEAEAEDPNKYIRTDPDEKFQVWVIQEENSKHRLVPALISSPDGFLVDVNSGKLEIKRGDNVTLEPSENTLFEACYDFVRKRDPEVDPDCDFVVKGEDDVRHPVVVNPKIEEKKISNCTLYDPNDQRIGRACLELVDNDPETNQPFSYSNAVMIDDSNQIKDVLVKQSTEEQILLKRDSETASFEKIKEENMTQLDDIPVKVLVLDSKHSGKAKDEIVFIPIRPFKVLKSKIIEAETGSALAVDGNTYEGPILIEEIKNGDDFEVFVLIPPEKRVTEEGEKLPKYVLVDLDDDIKQSLRDQAEFKSKITELRDQSINQTKLKADESVPKSLSAKKSNLQINQLDFKMIDPKGRQVRVNICDKENAPEEVDDSIAEAYYTVDSTDDLYYELECDDQRVAPSDMPRSFKTVPSGNNLSDRSTSRIPPSMARDTTPLPLNRATNHDASVPLRDAPQASRDSPAKVRIDFSSPINRSTMSFVGIGKVSTPKTDRSRSPKKYMEQLNSIRQHAARSILCYWRYSKRKPEMRKRFNNQFARAKKILSNSVLFKKFVVHYTTLSSTIDVDLALHKYMMLVSSNKKK